MKKLIVRGGTPLKGTIQISGSKNAVLPILAATLLTEEECVIENVPKLRDVATMVQLLQALGSEVEVDYPIVRILKGKKSQYTAPYDIVKTMRASFCVMGPLLARLHKAKVSMPGGCVIGVRPIDIHIKGFRELGAEIDIDNGYFIGRTDGLVGKKIFLGGMFGSSVMATENTMMAAVLAEGKTIIEQAACEPEIVDLANFLNKMGADIRGAGTPWIEINGVKTLHGARHSVIPDRIEAATYIIAAGVTGGDITLTHFCPDHLGAVLDALRQSGLKEEYISDTSCRFWREGRIKPHNISTLPYPGFPTDVQAQYMALMAIADGTTVITERIYPERFMHVPELNRMGANINREGPYAVVQGVERLTGAPVMASDLRGSASLLLAGLSAKGTTEIRRIYHLERGYEDFVVKIENCGGELEYAEDSLV